jgi:DivIVA domain-containing protein
MIGNARGAEGMREFTHEGINSHRFTSRRKKGYDTLEVDMYLEHLAEYVGWTQAELARHQETEQTALDLLRNAQSVAGETVAAARRNAEQVLRETAEGVELSRTEARLTLDDARAEADETMVVARRSAEQVLREAEVGVELARTEARRTLDDARAEGDRIMLSAQVRAESEVECIRSQIAELEVEGMERSMVLEQVAAELKNSVAESTAELRFVGLRLLEVAERYDVEFTARDEVIELDGGSHELRESVDVA